MAEVKLHQNDKPEKKAEKKEKPIVKKEAPVQEKPKAPKKKCGTIKLG